MALIYLSMELNISISRFTIWFYLTKYYGTVNRNSGHFPPLVASLLLLSILTAIGNILKLNKLSYSKWAAILFFCFSLVKCLVLSIPISMILKCYLFAFNSMFNATAFILWPFCANNLICDAIIRSRAFDVHNKRYSFSMWFSIAIVFNSIDKPQTIFGFIKTS